jgi:hypothetical protein
VAEGSPNEDICQSISVDVTGGCNIAPRPIVVGGSIDPKSLRSLRVRVEIAERNVGR